MKTEWQVTIKERPMIETNDEARRRLGDALNCINDVTSYLYNLKPPEPDVHDFAWAVRQMDAGHRVRRSCWYPSGDSISFGVTGTFVLNGKKPWCGYRDHFLATDWEIYSPEPAGHDFAWMRQQTGWVRKQSWNERYAIRKGLNSWYDRSGRLYSFLDLDFDDTNWVLADE